MVVISAFFALVFGSAEVGFQSRCDGHYDANDHREHAKGCFRTVRKWFFRRRGPHGERTDKL